MDKLDLDVFIVIKTEESLTDSFPTKTTVGEIFVEYADAEKYIDDMYEAYVAEQKDVMLNYTVITRKIN